MKLVIKNPKDVLASCMLYPVAGLAFWQSYNLPIGSFNNLGPGAVPTILAAFISVIATVILVRGLSIEGEGIERIHVREVSIIVASILLFPFAYEFLGLLMASVVTMSVASFAVRAERRQISFVVFVLFSALITYLFVELLNINLRIFPQWI